METDDIPWVTLGLASFMAVVYAVDPAITATSYTLLAPWMHSGWSHLVQNLLVFTVLGVWMESRVGRLAYAYGSVMFAYLALYLPVVAEYGGLSRGASGLTMMLTGYAVPTLIVGLVGLVESFELELRELATGLGMALGVAYLIVDALVTIQRFAGLEASPEGVSVASHTTGLTIGLLWFAWRAWRRGFDTA